MRFFRINRDNALLVFSLIGACILIAVVWMATAESPSRPLVDYLALYNEATKPEGYIESDNAAKLYQKAFDAFVEEPETLHDRYMEEVEWPGNFEEEELAVLRKWIESNSEALEYFKKATKKPYWWLKRKTPLINKISYDELGQLLKLVEVLSWNAKYNSMQEKHLSAFKMIITYYNAGKQKNRRGLSVIEQMIGESIKHSAIECAFIIIGKSQIKNEALKFLQDNLKESVGLENHVMDYQIDSLFFEEYVQDNFSNNTKGTGRVKWNSELAARELKYCSLFEGYLAKTYVCFLGPTKNDTIEDYKKILELKEKASTKSPWQIRNEGLIYFEEIKTIESKNWHLQRLGSNPESIFLRHYATRTHSFSLLATLGVLRFEGEIGRLPVSLGEVVEGGFLAEVPDDPFSGSGLVYKAVGDGFLLYSVGEDFVDDGGDEDTDNVYWPVQVKGKPALK